MAYFLDKYKQPKSIFDVTLTFDSTPYGILGTYSVMGTFYAVVTVGQLIRLYHNFSGRSFGGNAGYLATGISIPGVMPHLLDVFPCSEYDVTYGGSRPHRQPTLFNRYPALPCYGMEDQLYVINKFTDTPISHKQLDAFQPFTKL